MYPMPLHLNGAPQHSGSMTREDAMAIPRGVELIPNLEEYTARFIEDRLALTRQQARIPVNWTPDPVESSDYGSSEE